MLAGCLVEFATGVDLLCETVFQHPPSLVAGRQRYTSASSANSPFLPHFFLACQGVTLPGIVLPRALHPATWSAMLQDSSPLTAIAFSSVGDGLIAANASNHIGVYNVESMAATDWTRTTGAKLPARLLDMPGSIASIAVHPQVASLELLDWRLKYLVPYAACLYLACKGLVV